MPHLLLLHTSARLTRSITRQLGGHFLSRWKQRFPNGTVTERDLGLEPVPMISEEWISAAFGSPDLGGALVQSDECIAELVAADVVVIEVPMYNFGVPAALKAYFDQIIRVGRTFAFDPGATDPYRPLVSTKPVFVIESVGDGAFLPGGSLAELNFLEPHLRQMLGFIGLGEIHFVRAGYNEYQDERFRRSVSLAEEQIERVVNDLRNCHAESASEISSRASPATGEYPAGRAEDSISLKKEH